MTSLQSRLKRCRISIWITRPKINGLSLREAGVENLDEAALDLELS